MKEKPKKEKKESSSPKLIALRDFEIHRNDDHIVIKKGDVVDVPAVYLQNLKTEKVVR